MEGVGKWTVRRHDSTQPAEEWSVTLTEDEVKELLQRLACSDLMPREIVSATTGGNTLLGVRVDGGAMRRTLVCGDTPVYIAVLEN